VYLLRQDAISNQVNVDLTWSRAKHKGLMPLHHDDIISHFIMNLFQEYAIIEPNGAKQLEIPYFTEFNNTYIPQLYPSH
jgi:hypothetical protein